MANQPKAVANKVSEILRLVQGKDRFPVDVKEVALELSAQWFPEDPIKTIKPINLDGFEGMLARHPSGSKWLIAYNDELESGRIRFTLAHEFGHYLLHRQAQDEFNCTHKDMHDWDSQYRVIESEADTFASYLLMPPDDFRAQVAGHAVSIDLLMHCADRYGVSLMAAALKWREIAPGRAVVVAAKDGFLLWACSNKAAFQSGAYLSTRKEPFEVPLASLVNRAVWSPGGQTAKLNANIWFPSEPSDTLLIEHVFVADKGYNYTLGLLLLPDVEKHIDEEDDQLLVSLDGQMKFR